MPFLPKVTVTSAPGLGRTYNYKMGDTRVALLGAPSGILDDAAARLVAKMRRTALRCRELRVAVDFPTDCIALRKRETAVLPDGTVYTLSTTWVREPDINMSHSTESQTV